MRNIFGDQGNMERNFWEQGNSIKLNFGEHLYLFSKNMGTTVNFHRVQGNMHPPWEALITSQSELCIPHVSGGFFIGDYFLGASFKFACEGGGKLYIWISWLLPRRVCMASRKQEHIEHIRERCLIAEKNSSFMERAERD